MLYGDKKRVPFTLVKTKNIHIRLFNYKNETLQKSVSLRLLIREISCINHL